MALWLAAPLFSSTPFTDNTIKLWNTNTGQLITTLTGHLDSVYTIVEMLDSTLACGSGDKLIKIWNPNDGRFIKNLRGHTSWIYSLAVLVDGRLASCSDLGHGEEL